MTEVPENIRDRVSIEAGSITFPSAKRPWIWFLVGILGSGAALGVLGLLALLVCLLLTLVIGEAALILAVYGLSFGILPAIMIVLIGGFVGYMQTLQPRPITVAGPTGVYGGIFPPRPLPIETLKLTGEAGRKIVLWSGKRRLSTFTLTTWRRGWTFDTVTFVARHAAANAGVELLDERPEDAWRKWESDPVFRGEVNFDNRLADNRKQFPKHHATPPRVGKHTVDLEGFATRIQTGLFSSSTLRIDNTHLRFSNRSYALRSITRADVVFSVHKSDNSTYWRGRLQIVTEGRIKTVVKITVSHDGGERAARLKWLAEEVRRHAELARPVVDRGTVEDVPDNIAAMVQAQKRETS